MPRPNQRAIASDKAKNLILTCVRKYGPFSTAELTVRLGQLTRHQITALCKHLELEGALLSAHNGVDRIWMDGIDAGYADIPDDPRITLTHQDQQWYSYWQLPLMQRRLLPRPDWFPVPPQSGIDPEFHRVMT